jgi:hypothetical protein
VFGHGGMVLRTLHDNQPNNYQIKRKNKISDSFVVLIGFSFKFEYLNYMKFIVRCNNLHVGRCYVLRVYIGSFCVDPIFCSTLYIVAYYHLLQVQISPVT